MRLRIRGLRFVASPVWRRPARARTWRSRSGTGFADAKRTGCDTGGSYSRNRGDGAAGSGSFLANLPDRGRRSDRAATSDPVEHVATDNPPPGTHQALRNALRGIAVVQVVHLRSQESLVEAAAIAPYVHAILLDSGNPALAVKELGGTGRVHN